MGIAVFLRMRGVIFLDTVQAVAETCSIFDLTLKMYACESTLNLYKLFLNVFYTSKNDACGLNYGVWSAKYIYISNNV